MKKQQQQLGMPIGTAMHRLRKNVLFSLVVRTGLDICFRCNRKIKTERELSIEHQEPWLDSDDPVQRFFDLDNIGFSHLSCNCSAARRWNKKYFTDQARREANRELDKLLKRRAYTPAKRREKYLRLGL
jgi:hypothetical protein